MATVTGGGQTTVINVGSNDANGVAQALANVISAGLAAGTLTRVPNAQTNPASGPGVAVVQTTPPGGVVVDSPAVSVDLITANPTTGSSVVGGARQNVVGSGLPNQMVIGDNENITYFTNGGGGSIVLGDGNNLVGTPTIGGSAFNITTGNGSDTITALSGNNTIRPGGGNNLVFTGYGNNLVVGSTGNDVISGVGGARGTNDTVFGGSGSTLIGSFDKNLTFLNGSGRATVLAGNGSYTINGGSGGGLFAGGKAGNNVIIGGNGAGQSTIYGGGNGDSLFAAGSATTLILAGVGNETLSGAGSTGNNYFQNTVGNSTMFGGSGNDTFFVGTGNATVNGGGGNDIFALTNNGGGGTVAISGFNSNERVLLIGYGSAEQQNAINGQNNAGGNTTITLSDNTRVTFLGVGNINSGNFA